MAEGTAGKMRGAKASPRHKLMAACPHVPLKAPPTQFAIVPKTLSMWGNSTYGDCVSAEEAYAKACFALMCGLPETFITEQEVINWANSHGFLNGANLTDVMDSMAKSGMTDASGTIYDDGPYSGVDWSNEPVLQSAITVGPVKLGIDADALPSTAGTANGWYTISTGTFGSEDHCVATSGYGSAEYLFGQLGVAVPSGLDPTTIGYLLFTWSTIGFVTHGWLMGTVGEAWLRNPTTTGQAPAPTPAPTPTPVPTPTPMPTPTPSPTPAEFPNYSGSVKGSIVTPATTLTLPWLGAVSLPSFTIPVNLTATLSPASPSREIGFSFPSLFTDGFALVMAILSQSGSAIAAAMTRMASDQGVTLPPFVITELGVINWTAIIPDALAFAAACQTGNAAAITAAAAKVLTDLGLPPI